MGKKNKPPPVDDPSYANQSAFRIVERSFRRKGPFPSEVQNSIIDPHQPPVPNTTTVTIPHPSLFCPHFSSPTSSNDSPETIQALHFTSHPGLYILPNPFEPPAQRSVIKDCLRTWTRRPNVYNLDTHYVIDGGEAGLWGTHESEWSERQRKRRKSNKEVEQEDEKKEDASTKKKRKNKDSMKVDDEDVVEPDTLLQRRTGDVGWDETTYKDDSTKPTESLKIDPPTTATPFLTPLRVSQAVKQWRWSSIGMQYNWSTKEYHTHTAPPIPPLLNNLTMAVVQSLEKETGYASSNYKPEAGIINFYQTSDSLMAHQDRSEQNAVAPLVSFSFGQSCVFLIGKETREEEKPIPIVLRSGDVLVMSGESRRCFHGVPRILEGTLPEFLQRVEGDEDWDVFADFLKTTRVNVNVRQVYPVEE
ncbi:hypothetical protein HDV05_001893 [Chytridiales sp. JEL 0842]|nr:hypothetical protein HDV05_001893 [Chytridiales sp. JEL 0842]